MKAIPLTRCVFLMPFADILTDVGAPTPKLLEKYRLPASLEESFNHFVPILPAIDFAVAGQRSQGISDIAYLAAKRLSFDDLTEQLQASVLQAPTLYAALKQLVRLAPIEDTNLRIWLERDEHSLKVYSVLAGTRGLPHLEHSQWLQNLPIIYIVRQFTGPDWAPATIAFEARYTPSLETRSHWPNTRFRSGEHASWIDIPISLLSLPSRASRMRQAPRAPDAVVHGNSDVIGTLKMMLPAYVSGTLPSIADIAEMAGTSVRSLQRHLLLAGLTYSGLIHQVRYEIASKMLANSEAKIIDAAAAAGYDDPAHFTRAFRRIAGVTPREFRRNQQSRPSERPFN